MKRTPLARGTKPLQRTPMKRGSKKQAKDSREMAAVDPDLLMRSGGRCECGRGCGRWGEVRHHVESRRHGDNSLDNLRWLSDACHKWLHANPKQARALGLLPPSAKDDLPPL